MKQYCRYCIYLVTGNGIYCTEKHTEMAESTAKSINQCNMFEFCEIDAFGETSGYKPRKRNLKGNNGQMSLFEEVNKNDN